MNALLDLVRPDLRGFAGYRSARCDDARGEIWLNANESPWPNPSDPGAGCRRYPEPQPLALRNRLASLYGCAAEQLLIGRGSDEAIDLLVRALCTAGQDAVIVTPPVVGMYAVRARLQDVRVVEVLPRYHPSWAKWVIRVPLLREVASWNSVIVVERR